MIIGLIILLGVTDQIENKINEKNLLNFYLSSITIKDFKYEPTKKTKTRNMGIFKCC